MKFLSRLVPILSLCLVGVACVAPKQTSAQVQPAAPAIQRDIEYGAAGGEKQYFNVYGAQPGKKLPALVLIHGGGWIGGSRNDLDGLGVGAAGNGYVAFSVGYRFVKDGKNRFPAQIDDVQRAVRFIRAHAEDYGIDSNKIGAMGFSAGGQLVSLLGTTETRDNSDPALAAYSSRVQCVVDVYGPSDFTGGFKVDPAITPGGANTLGEQLVLNFLGSLPEAKANYIAASPIQHIDKKTVPFLIFHGAKDNLVPLAQSTTFNDALQKAGVESKIVIFPNAGHGYSDQDSVRQTNQLSLEFFNRHLKG